MRRLPARWTSILRSCALLKRIPRRQFLAPRAMRMTCVLLVAMGSGAWSQTPVRHEQYSSDDPPGAIGRMQLQRGHARQGYYQPVRLSGVEPLGIHPADRHVEFPDATGDLMVGLLIGSVYRFHITQIPHFEGRELFPTVEVIDRTYPPVGSRLRHPIRIELAPEDLRAALEGKQVTRVVYVAPPLPRHDDPSRQSYFEVLAQEDPLHVADVLGRPVAILRIGSRLPGPDGPDSAFLFGSPPLEQYPLDPVICPTDVGGDLPWSPPGISCPWPRDEYVCDGGDDDTLARIRADGKIMGVEVEDTVAAYDTLDGRRLIEPSNRVCLYAPRFAATRKITGLQQQELHQRMEIVDQPTQLLRYDEWLTPRPVHQAVIPRRQVGTKIANILKERTRGVTAANVVRPLERREGIPAYEDFTALQLGVAQYDEKAELAEYTAAAIQWSHNAAPEVILDDQAAVVDKTVARVDAVVHYELPPGAPRLRLLKVASCCDAQPGEYVQFTLRFDNVGPQSLDRVTIVDHLSGRLEYVEDSAQCDREANFLSAQDGETLVLTWTLRKPLPPRMGGLIRFRCRVR